MMERRVGEMQTFHDKPNLTSDQRKILFQFLTKEWSSEEGKLEHGAIQRAADFAKVSRRTIWRFWKRAKPGFSSERPAEIESRKRNSSGGKKKLLDLIKIQSAPLPSRATMRGASTLAGASPATIYRRVKSGELKAHASSLRPLLTRKNEIERARFCVSMLNSARAALEKLFDQVHVDEKWFHITKDKQKYYLTLDEPEPHREVKLKRFVQKVMF